jgi:hypothetical protein
LEENLNERLREELEKKERQIRREEEEKGRNALDELRKENDETIQELNEENCLENEKLKSDCEIGLSLKERPDLVGRRAGRKGKLSETLIGMREDHMKGPARPSISVCSTVWQINPWKKNCIKTSKSLDKQCRTRQNNAARLKDTR